MEVVESPMAKPIDRLWIAIAFAIAIAVLPLYSAELYVLTGLSTYQFFPLVYAFAIYVGWKRWIKAEGTIGHRRGASLWPETACVLFIFACLTLHAGLFGPWLGGAAGLAAIAAGIFAVGRLRRVQLWDLWFLLIVSSRLPLNLNFKLASTLQTVSSELSSLTLDSLGIVHFLAGNVVKLPTGDLMVAEACSGVISIMSIIACSMIVAIWNDRPWVHSLVLFASGILYATLMNVVRIVTIAVAQVLFDFDLSHGWIHEMFGVMVFLVTFSSLIKTDYLLLAILEPEPNASTDGDTSSPSVLAMFRKKVNFRLFPSPPQQATFNAKSKIATGKIPKLRVYAAIAFAVSVGIYHSFALYTNYVQSVLNTTGLVAGMIDFDSDIVAEAVAPWKIVKDELLERDTISELAPFSKSYTLQNPVHGTKLTLSFDFPFYRIWHDLTKCYVHNGMTMKTRVIHREAAIPDLSDCQFITADFVSKTEGYGYLIFANLNEDGRLVAPPPYLGDFGFMINEIVHVFQQHRHVSLNPNKLFQVQVFSKESKPPSEELRQEMEQLFYSGFKVLRRHLAENHTSNSNE